MATSSCHSSSHSSLLFLILAAGVCRFTLASEPKAMTWSAKAFGPDGPWNAVELSIGGQDTISMFPGRMWHSFVLTADYCALNTSINHCEAGTYFKGTAPPPGPTIMYLAPPQEMLVGVPLVGNRTGIRLDTLDLQFSGDQSDVIPGASMALVDSQMFAYPDGTRYPLFAGCLSLGAPDVNQTFVRNDGTDDGPINGTIIPWYLAQTGVTPSSSFGMHIGSAVNSARVPGSLLFGGYDRNRVAGPVLSVDGDLYTPVLLKDIAITTILGTSPFPNATGKVIPNLLSANNNTIASSAGLPVLLDPCSPYLTLPESVCANIAAHLPVTYVPNLGLYLWDQSSPLYPRIISSATALSFTLLGSDNTHPLTIHVPFAHLNLTLTPPLAPSTSPIPYFPCFTGGDGVSPDGGSNGASVLGRAFLQDAFLGAIWGKPGRVFVAQAPGPNVQPGRNAVGIHVEDDVQEGGNDWATSWDGFWTALNQDQNGGSGSGSGGTGLGPAGGNGGGEGLSVGAKAGVGVGVVMGFAVILSLSVVLLRRRKAERAKRSKLGQDIHRFGQQTAGEGSAWKQETSDYDTPNAPAEMVGTSAKDNGTMFEVDGATRNRPMRADANNRSMYELA